MKILLLNCTRACAFSVRSYTYIYADLLQTVHISSCFSGTLHYDCSFISTCTHVFNVIYTPIQKGKQFIKSNLRVERESYLWHTLMREHVSLREHACVSSRGAQSTELVALYIGYWTLNNYYYYTTHVSIFFSGFDIELLRIVKV